jgi:hypothetical protein
MFLEEIKNAILTSKQLKIKSESFSKLNKFFGKEIDDFSFKVEDTINLELDVGEKEYSINCIPSEKNLDSDFYYFIVNEALKEVKFIDSSINYLFNLNLRNTYKLTFDFSIELKHSYDNKGFEVKKLHRNNILIEQKYQSNLISLNFRIPYEEESYVGFALEESKEILEKLNLHKEYLIRLEAEMKNVLLNTIHETSPKQKEFITISRELVNNWLNTNCKSELRNLIEVNPYCYYFSLSEEWILPIDFLNSKCEYWFEGPKQTA